MSKSNSIAAYMENHMKSNVTVKIRHDDIIIYHLFDVIIDPVDEMCYLYFKDRGISNDRYFLYHRAIRTQANIETRIYSILRENETAESILMFEFQIKTDIVTGDCNVSMITDMYYELPLESFVGFFDKNIEMHYHTDNEIKKYDKTFIIRQYTLNNIINH